MQVRNKVRKSVYAFRFRARVAFFSFALNAFSTLSIAALETPETGFV
jgi:hypothetical protein